MKKRPTNKLSERELRIEEFLNGAGHETKEQKDTLRNSPYKSGSKFPWPLFEEEYTPMVQEGSSLSKNMTLALKEFEWKTIDFHTKVLKVSKSAWIRYAIMKLLDEEQRAMTEELKG